MSLDRYLNDSECRIYAENWIEAWKVAVARRKNGSPEDTWFSDLMEMYGSEIIYTSPFVLEIFPNHKHKILSGLTIIRNYFIEGLKKYDAGEFDLLKVYAGFEGFTIVYDGYEKRTSCEHFTLNDSMKIKRANVFYAAPI